MSYKGFIVGLRAIHYKFTLKISLSNYNTHLYGYMVSLQRIMNKFVFQNHFFIFRICQDSDIKYKKRIVDNVSNHIIFVNDYNSMVLHVNMARQLKMHTSVITVETDKIRCTLFLLKFKRNRYIWV